MSDGSSELTRRDPDTFAVLGTVTVSDGGSPVHRLNDLEWIRGEVFANRWLTDRIARIAMLFDEAVELFEGDRARASHWFRSPRKALGGAAPIEYADTEPGAREVRDLIGRIEHGVFA